MLHVIAAAARIAGSPAGARRLRSAASGAAVALALSLGVASGVAGCRVHPDPGLPERVAWNPHVRPLLADRCFACHGPDGEQRQAELRLDRREVATAVREGRAAIVPGRPEASELLRRVRSTDPDERMPPPDSHRAALAPGEIALLERWIEQGAEYEPHWSHLPIARPPLPEVRDASWVANPVDRFVLARLEALGLAPSPPSDPANRVRRLHLDLLGLPPEPEVVAAFEAEPGPEAFARLADRLLAAPAHAERLTTWWLDLVRYADTNGYHADEHRNIHPYRDYVIGSFHENRPFDRFTVEQLAGDLLPDATLDQRIASGYNRLNQVTTETGAQAKEYRAKYAADRVRTTASVWLGATLGCAECHDHKFDPFTQRDFYAFAAFFADLEERGQYSPVSLALPPELPVPSPRDAETLARLDAEIAELVADRDRRAAALGADFAREEARWRRGLRPPRYRVLRPTRLRAARGSELRLLPDGSILAGGAAPDIERYELHLPAPVRGGSRLRLEVLGHPSLPAGGPGRGADGRFVLSEIGLELREGPDAAAGEPIALQRPSASWPLDPPRDRDVARAVDGRARDTGSGWSLAAPGGQHAVFETLAPVSVEQGELVVWLEQSAGGGATLGRFRLSLAEPAEGARAARPPDPPPAGWFPIGPPAGAAGDGARVLRTGLSRPRHGMARLLEPEAESFEVEIALSDLRLASDVDRIHWSVQRPGAPAHHLRVGLLRVAGELGLVCEAVGGPLRSRRGQSLGPAARVESLRLKLRWVDSRSAWRLFFGLNGDPPQVEVEGGELVVDWTRADDAVTSLVVDRLHGVGSARVSFDGFAVRPYRLAFRDLPGPVARSLELDPERRRPGQTRAISAFYREIAAPLREANAAIDARRALRARVESAIPTTLVSVSGEPRPVRVLPRGDWMDDSGEPVGPAVPAFLPGLSETGGSSGAGGLSGAGGGGNGGAPDRLALARWIAAPENPLTARVVANHLFALAFGRGIATTLDDLGSQGAWPTHPELLDWLAAELIESGWDLRHVLRLLVTSSAYQQASALTPALAERDPGNRWLARQSPFRLDAEMVRDAALAISGLLSDEVGGPPVKPYQPPGYWDDIVSFLKQSSPAGRWQISPPPQRYRRGLYTYWKRSFPHPSLLAFDAPTREECTAQRVRSNTPLQALVLLNDPTYVEAARAFAARMLREGGSGVQARLAWGWRRATSRALPEGAAEVLTELLERDLRHYAERRGEARRLLRVGAAPLPADRAADELAAWTSVARVLLNLNETIHRY